MKTLITILAAAVVAGLAGFFVFEFCGAFGVLQSKVFCDIPVFVFFIVVLTVTAAALALGLARLVLREDQRLVGRLEERIRTLEEEGRKREPA